MIFLIPLLLLLSACCLQKMSPELKDVDRFVLKQRTIRVDFHPYKSIRYKDYLIIQGEDNERFCFKVYDLKTGKTDAAFQRQIALDSIQGFMIRNRQLMACSTSNRWKVWKNGSWQDRESYSDFFFSQIIRDQHSLSLKFLHEDATYFVYGVSLGEFGGATLFYHKPSGKTYSFQRNAPVDAFKTKEGYELTVPNFPSVGGVTSVTIHDPLKLELVPDNLNFLRNEFTARTFRPLYDFWKMNEQRNLSFRLFFGRFTMDEVVFECKAYDQYNSLLKHDPNIDFNLDTVGANNPLLCHGAFDFKGKTTFLLKDSMFYLGQMEKGKLKRIQTFPEQVNLPYFTSTVEHDKGRHWFSLWLFRGYKEHGFAVRHVWIAVSGTTIYRYNIVHTD